MTWPQHGDRVYWHQSAKPGGWHAGTFLRFIQRGRHAGDAEVRVGGELLPARVLRVPGDRIRQRPGRDG